MEAIVAIAVFAVLLWMLLSALMGNRRDVPWVNCVNNLQQIGISFHLWEGDHGDQYPTAVSATNGGVRELVAAGDVVACFRVMSNELATPKILVCPQDATRRSATNFDLDLKTSRISYFVGVDAVESDPQAVLSGDGNLARNGRPVPPGIFDLRSNTLAWTPNRHTNQANVLLADGSVQSLPLGGAKGFTSTNRLAVP